MPLENLKNRLSLLSKTVIQSSRISKLVIPSSSNTPVNDTPSMNPVLMSSGKTRPIGVTILAILALVVGGIGLAAGIAFLAFSSMLAGIGLGVGGILATLGVIIGGVVLFIGLIWLLTGWGLLTAKGWSRTLTLIFSILSLIGMIFFAASGSISGIVGCAIFVLMLYYLFTPPVKNFFGSAPSFSKTSGNPGSPSLSSSAASLATSFGTPLGGSSRSSFGSSNTNTSGSSSSSSYGGNRFCSNCGSTLSPSSNKCPSCGTTN